MRLVARTVAKRKEPAKTEIQLTGATVAQSAFIKHEREEIQIIIPAETVKGTVKLITPEGEIISKTSLNLGVEATVTSVTDEALPGTDVTITFLPGDNYRHNVETATALRRAGLMLLGTAAIGAGLWFGSDWWFNGRFIVSIDDLVGGGEQQSLERVQQRDDQLGWDARVDEPGGQLELNLPLDAHVANVIAFLREQADAGTVPAGRYAPDLRCVPGGRGRRPTTGSVSTATATTCSARWPTATPMPPRASATPPSRRRKLRPGSSVPAASRTRPKRRRRPLHSSWCSMVWKIHITWGRSCGPSMRRRGGRV